MALAFRGRRAEPDHAGRLGVARRLAADLRRAEPPRSGAVARRPASHHHELQGHPADGRRPALHQHADVGGRRHRRADGRDAVGLQPQELRGRHHHDVRPLEPARRGVLVERAGPDRRADLLRHRQRLSRLRRREDRATVRRLRRRRPAGPDGRHPARHARRARLAERAALLRPVPAHRVRRYGRHADVDLQLQRPQGDAARLDARLRRAQRPDALDVPHHPAGRRVRQRDMGRRFLARDRQGGRLDDDEHRPRARLHLPAAQHRRARLLRRTPPGRQPVRREPRRPRPGDRRAGLALPGRPPRAVGLRPARRPQPDRHHGRRPADRGGRANHQAGLHVRLRPGDRRAGLADRRAPGADRHRHRGRDAVADPTVSDLAVAVRLPGRGHRRSRRLHPRDTADGDRGGRAVPHRPPVHAPQPARHHRAPRVQRRKLGRRRGRSRHRHPVRAVGQPLHGQALPHARAGRGKHPGGARGARRAGPIARRCRRGCRCSSRPTRG